MKGIYNSEITLKFTNSQTSVFISSTEAVSVLGSTFFGLELSSSFVSFFVSDLLSGDSSSFDRLDALDTSRLSDALRLLPLRPKMLFFAEK